MKIISSFSTLRLQGERRNFVVASWGRIFIQKARKINFCLPVFYWGKNYILKRFYQIPLYCYPLDFKTFSFILFPCAVSDSFSRKVSIRFLVLKLNEYFFFYAKNSCHFMQRIVSLNYSFLRFWWWFFLRLSLRRNDKVIVFSDNVFALKKYAEKLKKWVL